MKIETVTMKSPAGELREVEPTPENLTPLMAAGWHQAPQTRVELQASESQEAK